MPIFYFGRGTTKSDHPHRSFGSKASKEDDEPTLEVLGVWTSLPIWKEAARAQSRHSGLVGEIFGL